MWNPESGQSLFDFSVREIAEDAAPFVHERDSATLDADGWYEVGCDLEIADVAQAEEAYRRALEINPRHADANVNLGRLLHEKRAPAAAEKHYRVALETNPDHETAAFNLGVALEDLGRTREAIDAYRDALRVDPDNADAHYNIAGLLEKRGEKASALSHLKDYARLRRA
jgi:tetratricopeptide (TPR) repeat protein